MRRKIVSFIVLSLTLGGAVAPLAATKPSPWLTISVDEALRRAAQTRRAVIVQVYAHWCTPCNALTNEVLETDEARTMLGQALGVRVDFDTPAGQRVTKRFNVLNLPTTLVLRHNGEEIGRVEGYGGRKEFLDAVRDALAGKLGLETLAEKLKREPRNIELQLTVAQALLVRGRESEAYARLKPYLSRSDKHGADAMRIWGRYLLRAKKRYVEASAHFVRAAGIFTGSKTSHEFLYWAAKAYHERKMKDRALEIFRIWVAAEPRSPIPRLYQVDFLVQFNYPLDQCRAALKSALQLTPREAWLHYLAAKIEARAKNRNAALEEIRKALTLSPKKAIYLNFQRSLGVRG